MCVFLFFSFLRRIQNLFFVGFPLKKFDKSKQNSTLSREKVAKNATIPGKKVSHAVQKRRILKKEGKNWVTEKWLYIFKDRTLLYVQEQYIL